MTRKTMIEVRRHVRAIDLALKKDIDQSVAEEIAALRATATAQLKSKAKEAVSSE